MNGETNANNSNNVGGASNNRTCASNGGFNLSNLFDLSKLGNVFGNGTRGNNPLNNLRRMFGGNMNRRYMPNRNMLKVVPIEEAYRRIKSGNVLLIDVRTEMEYKTVKIKGSVNIPLDRLQSEITSLVTNREEYIMLYCATGSRVRRAAQILWSLGYTNINIWEGAGINTFAFHDLIVYNNRQQEE